MNYETFITLTEPPDTLSPYLAALWHERHGDWNRAHDLLQDLPDDYASVIHAYLHRVEGDLPNARYWYAQAKRPAEMSLSLAEEWEALVREMLSL